MGRKPTKCPKKCSHHLFSLKPVRYSAYFSREVQVSFCPATLKHPHLHPTFNRDRKYYTPSFNLKEDLVKYDTNDEIYKVEHIKFCHEQLKEKSVMLQPKPRSKCQYCHSCKEEYTDYSEHINSFSHKEKLRANKFSQYIDELIDQGYPSKASFETSLFIDQENLSQTQTSLSATSLSISNQPLQNQISPGSPFKLMSGRQAFEMLPLMNKPQILKKTIIIEDQASQKDKNEYQELLFKRILTTPADFPKRIDSPRLNYPIILNQGFN